MSACRSVAPERVPRMTDRKVIDEFVAFLAGNGRPGLVVTDHPEDHKDGEIDALAGDLAIEHTSSDALKHQRRDSDWFVRLIADLEQDAPKPSYLLWLFIREAHVRRPQRWEALRDAIRAWLRSRAADALPDGDHPIEMPGFLHSPSVADLPAAVPCTGRAGGRGA